MSRLPIAFFERSDVVTIARDLIGKRLTTVIDDLTVSGLITETEAYAGETDRASHAFGGKRTARTETMYGPPGTTYVYLCYGMHAMLNVVTHSVGVPHAVLVRGVAIDQGIEPALKRRNITTTVNLSNGPGKVARAFGLSHRQHNGLFVNHGPVFIDRGIDVDNSQMYVGPRIGVDYAGPDALLPYRFLWLQ